MTGLQKHRIAQLRRGGESYARIAEALSISENTIKSYCRRNNLGGNMAAPSKEAASQSFCRRCGEEMPIEPGKKPRKFCSDACRAAWWASHPDRLNRRAVYSFVCPTCGAAFESYGNKGRKYCSHVCYITGRFGKGASV
jgi:endogenous inhibitor of DNA gyrase (YacG/DUF329 family)